MQVFISWSKPLSKKVAESLSEWLKYIPLSIEPWVSGPDIDPGTRWNRELAEALQDTNFGILCITNDNQKAPWICFEAGALAKTIEKSHVIPYLIDIKPDQLEHPLKQFQAIEANKEGTLSLLRIFYKLAENKNLSESNLMRAFEKWWPDLEKEIEAAKREISGPDISKKDISMEDIKGSIDIAIDLLESLSSRAAKRESLMYGQFYTAHIRVVTIDKPGILSTITSCLKSAGVNVTRASVETMPGHRGIANFIIQVMNKEHLRLVNTKLRELKDVTSVESLQKLKSK